MTLQPLGRRKKLQLEKKRRTGELSFRKEEHTQRKKNVASLSLTTENEPIFVPDSPSSKRPRLSSPTDTLKGASVSGLKLKSTVQDVPELER